MLQLYPPIIATSLQWLFPSGPRVAIVERFHCSSVTYGCPITGIPSQLFVIGYPHDPHTNFNGFPVTVSYSLNLMEGTIY